MYSRASLLTSTECCPVSCAPHLLRPRVVPTRARRPKDRLLHAAGDMPGDDATELPQSRRPDGTLRPVIRVRKGYVPPEEQQTYDRFKDTTPAGTVFGAETVDAGPAKG